MIKEFHKRDGFRHIYTIYRLYSSQTHYEVLGLKRTASHAEIRMAFIELSKKYHPDKQQGNSESFKRINEAYTILSRDETKQLYDASLISGIPPSYHPSSSHYYNNSREEMVGAHGFAFHRNYGKVKFDHWSENEKRRFNRNFFISLGIFVTLMYAISFGTFISMRNNIIQTQIELRNMPAIKRHIHLRDYYANKRSDE